MANETGRIALFSLVIAFVLLGIGSWLQEKLSNWITPGEGIWEGLTRIGALVFGILMTVSFLAFTMIGLIKSVIVFNIIAIFVFGLFSLISGCGAFFGFARCFKPDSVFA